MSASLVGSEMCIRDRSVAHGLSQDSIGIQGIRGQAGAMSQGAPFGHILCLLYTSDAADDM
eukprot:10937100-Alexandrium_andersonii.AAC.1